MNSVISLLAAILNSMWQAAIVAAAVWLALRAARRINAATRFAIWWAGMAAACDDRLGPAHLPSTARPGFRNRACAARQSSESGRGQLGRLGGGAVGDPLSPPVSRARSQLSPGVPVEAQ